MSNRYTLLDGVRLNAESPDTFHIPSASDIDALRVGDFIKVGANFDPALRLDPNPAVMALFEAKFGKRPVDTERFWVKIAEITPDGYACTVCNDLVFSGYHGLQDGDPIPARRENILSILRAES